MRLVSSLVLAAALTACPGSTSVPDPVTTPVQPVVVANFSENTSPETRDAHRQAVAHLRASEFRAACDVLDGVPLSERRRLTDYLAVLCATRLPDRALSADTEAARIQRIDEPPFLTDAQVAVLNQHRAWIAGIQDRFGGAAQSSLNLQAPPLPPELQGSNDLSRLSAWRERGDRFHRPTYRRVLESAELSSLGTRLRLNEILADLHPLTAHQILFVDTTGMTLPALPSFTLPADGEL